jgi:hypothetical protein
MDEYMFDTVVQGRTETKQERADREMLARQHADFLADEDAKQKARTNAASKLAKLGLTVEEIQAILL